MLAAEIGLDMAQFPTAGHLASWAGMCPGNHESAGKHKGGKTRRGSKWLRRALIEAACAAGRARRTYLGGQYRRLVVRRGKKRAVVAVGHSILVIAYHLLKNHDTYRDLGPTYLDERRRARAQQRAIEQLQVLGYQVTITPKEVVAA